MTYDVVVIGGGFYGCSIAAFLKAKGRTVLLIERESDLLRRASYCNQARIHSGFHYPRSFHTAYRSRVNSPLFIRDFADCVSDDFVSLYCVARARSNVTSRQFRRFCDLIGAPLRPANKRYEKLFNPRLIESVFEVREYAFDGEALRQHFRDRLDALGVEVWLRREVAAVTETDAGRVRVSLADGAAVEASFVFNCTYSNLNHIRGLEGDGKVRLKHEIAEIALIQPPVELEGLAVTVMDGPFFSCMPFPARGMHSLSHVTYTPHAAWVETPDFAPSPYRVLQDMGPLTRIQFMLKDAQRYLPALARAVYKDSLFEVKTVLASNEVDDGRPILFRTHGRQKRIVSVLGGKIDNIYDVLEIIGSHEAA